MRVRSKSEMAILAIAAVAIVGILAAARPEVASVPATGSSRLVSVQEFPGGEMCAWDDPAGARRDLIASLQQGNLFSTLQRESGSALIASLQPGTLFSAPQRRETPSALEVVTRAPVFRTIADSYPVYTAVGVYLATNQVVLQDNNLWSARMFGRLDNTPVSARFTEEKGILQGGETEIQFNNGLYIDQANGDIYSVESDTGDKMVVFSPDQRGNVRPKRILNTPHRAYSIAVDEEKQELYVTVEYPPEIVVYRKQAGGDEQPLRRIQGDRALLEGPHGIAVDSKNQLLFVNTWGHSTSFRNPGTGRFNPPAINIYALNASGDTAPIRRIQGDRTELDWPGNMSLHPNGELYVSNDVGQSVLVFNGLTYQRGNVPPARIIKGDKTALNYPTGVFVDTKNQELWVSNLGNSSATVYPLMANGNVAPLRTIRSAPYGHESLTFGRTAAVAYDPNREEILVPN